MRTLTARRRLRWPLLPAGAGVAAGVIAFFASAAGSGAAGSCGLPSTSPVWIDYGEGTLKPDVRAVLARPGVVVASSGTALPKYFRDHGAATTYFVLHLPALVGEPADPADPRSIEATADTLYSRAVTSTACTTPTIALNELFGTGLATPWSTTNATYRADVLALMQRLRARGALPALLLQGNPNTAGDAAAWWRQVAQAGDIVYEAYYDAKRILSLGAVVGTRRTRLGERGFVSQFEQLGITPDRLGIMLGFHSARVAGIGGRQGLEPTSAWLRVVKWEALGAAQVAADEHLGSVWSWGWGTLGPDSADPDKAAAACVYLWARDQSLCDGPAAAGADFIPSLAEGRILLAPGSACTLAGGGRVSTATVRALARVLHNQHDALSAAFSRIALRPAAPVGLAAVLRAEQEAIDRSFHGSRRGYLEALTRSHATLGVARAAIRDELRRRAIAASLAASSGGQTMLEWTAEREAKLVDSAVCRGDDLPGGGGFPQTNDRDVGVVTVLARLPYLFADRTPPAAPASATISPGGTGILVLRWAPGSEADLAGYRVYRSTDDGTFEAVGPFLDRPVLVDAAAPRGRPSRYVVRAVDTSGNQSAPSPELTATAP